MDTIPRIRAKFIGGVFLTSFGICSAYFSAFLLGLTMSWESYRATMVQTSAVSLIGGLALLGFGVWFAREARNDAVSIINR